MIQHRGQLPLVIGWIEVVLFVVTDFRRVDESRIAGRASARIGWRGEPRHSNDPRRTPASVLFGNRDQQVAAGAFMSARVCGVVDKDSPTVGYPRR
jgi:hypothetical protein